MVFTRSVALDLMSLVVDDLKSASSIVTQMLERFGSSKITEIPDPEVSTQSVTGGAVDLIIADL